MGALRSVAGPFSNCGNWNSNPNFPYYTGPCGACGCSCCNDDYPPCPPYPPAPPSSICTGGNLNASFTATAPVTLTAGEAVSLSRATAPTDAFTVTSEGIRIYCPGVYMATYTINVPEDTAISSVFALALNGTRVPASAVNVITANDATSDSYTMHALIQANSGDLLTLTGLSDVSITASPGANVFTLTLTKVY